MGGTSIQPHNIKSLHYQQTHHRFAEGNSLHSWAVFQLPHPPVRSTHCRSSIGQRKKNLLQLTNLPLYELSQLLLLFILIPAPLCRYSQWIILKDLCIFCWWCWSAKTQKLGHLRSCLSLFEFCLHFLASNQIMGWNSLKHNWKFRFGTPYQKGKLLRWYNSTGAGHWLKLIEKVDSWLIS